MNKFWKQTMALFLAFVLVFGTLVPVVAWAEEPANVEKPNAVSEPEAPAEEETQAEPEKKLTEEETEGKATAAPGELEFSKENTPDGQGAPASGKLFTLTKRPVGGSSQEDILIGEYDTFYKVTEECAKHQEDKTFLYMITMHGDYTIPADENVYTLQYINVLLQSEEGKQYTLKRLGTRLVTYVAGECELETKNIIFDGNNDGEFTFISEGGELTLGKGTVIQNFIDVPDYDGPAIYMQGPSIPNVGPSTLTIEPGVVIRNNKSEAKNSGVISLNGSRCTLNINGGTFENNISTKYFGGVIVSWGTVNIAGGTFVENKAPYGGVIASMGTLNITGGTFRNNTATETGGVIWANKECTIDGTGKDVRFSSNTATKNGGAIYTKANTTITNTSFSSNTAMQDGGAIFRDVNKPGVNTNVVIKNSSFDMNKAMNSGGAVMVRAVTTIQDTSFTQNEANVGGAVYTKANITLKNSTFDSNTAEKWGGAVFCAENTKNTIESSDFVSNHAKQWGGAIFSNGELDVSGTSFTKNDANDGGAVLAIAKAKFSKNIFTSNQATELGGAVVVANVADIANTTFESNKAQNGGAIAISSKDAKVDIKESAFKKNYAEHQGGAISDAAAQYEPKITDPKAYRNLTTDAKTLFQGNKADGGLFNPPENYEDFTNLQFDPQSDVKHGKLTRESLLNNYDVNYDNNMRTIMYDANGGRFADGKRIKTEEHSLGANIQIMEAPTRRGYTFQYWKGSKYQPGDPYTVKDNHTFVAQWEKDKRPPRPNITEEIIVNPNGGTFSDGTTGRKTYPCEIGETFVLPAAPTHEGYKFIAWEGKSGTYQPGDKYTVQRGGDVFTARWEEEKKPEEKPSVKPNIKTPRGTPLTPDEIAKILAGMKKTVPAIPRAGVGK